MCEARSQCARAMCMSRVLSCDFVILTQCHSEDLLDFSLKGWGWGQWGEWDQQL